MMAVFVTDVFLGILNLSLCVLNAINGNYFAAGISAVAVIWCACFAAHALKCHFNYTKIKKSIEKEYAERRKSFERLVSPSSTREEWDNWMKKNEWRSWTYKNEPNIYHGRIAHLAFRHRKARVRKKNMNRILRGK